jgi:hypothetical protein
MKAKALIVALLCVMGLTALSIGNAEAGQWYTCTMSQVGNTFNNYFITVSDVAGTAFPDNTTFVIPPDFPYAKEMYAAALTGFANSTNVWVWLESVGPYSPVYGVMPSK